MQACVLSWFPSNFCVKFSLLEFHFCYLFIGCLSWSFSMCVSLSLSLLLALSHNFSWTSKGLFSFFLSLFHFIVNMKVKYWYEVHTSAKGSRYWNACENVNEQWLGQIKRISFLFSFIRSLFMWTSPLFCPFDGFCFILISFFFRSSVRFGL